MRIGSTVAALALAAAASLTVSGDARAFCGFYVSGADAKMFNNATMVVLMRDGTRTVLSMQNNYQGPPQDFALVVPVPIILQKENVKTLPRAVFDRIDQLAAPRLVEYWEQDPCPPEREEYDMEAKAAYAPSAPGGAPAPAQSYGVKVEAQFTVGEYEIVILSAKDALGLDAWLRDNKYKIPEGAAEVLRPYVASGMKFFVAKVDTKKVKFENGMATLSPLRFLYDTDTFMLPVRLGLLNSAGTQDLIVHILARGTRYEVANFPNTTIPTNLDVAESARGKFGEFYATLFDKVVEKNPKAVVTEYAWAASTCDPCPGPTLSPSELAVLGADVLPSASTPVPRVVVNVPPGTPPIVYRVSYPLRGAVHECYAPELTKTPTLQGKLRVEVDSKGPLKLIPVDGFPSGELARCIKTRIATLKAEALPTAKEPVVLDVDVASMPNPSATANLVLTRLHARYRKDTLGEDLVFRDAPAIVGGREVRGADGKLEATATASSMNNFQARYAIRHPWTGAIACDNPRRGVWGGPPGGRQAPPQPAQGLAFAPRGGVKLASFLAADVAPTSPAPAPSGSAAGKSEGVGACGCRVPGAPSEIPSGAGLFAAALGTLLVARRRRS